MATYGDLPATISPAGFDQWVRGVDANAMPRSVRGVADGVAPLDAESRVPALYLPPSATTLPDPTGQPDGRWLRTEGGAYVFTDAPEGGGGEAMPYQRGALTRHWEGGWLGPKAGTSWFNDFLYATPYAIPGASNGFDEFVIEVVTAGADTALRLGLYDAINGADGRLEVGALVRDFGAIAGDTAGLKAVALSPVFVPDPGLYFMATAGNANVRVFSGITSGPVTPLAASMTATAGSVTQRSGSQDATWVDGLPAHGSEANFGFYLETNYHTVARLRFV